MDGIPSGKSPPTMRRIGPGHQRHLAQRPTVGGSSRSVRANDLRHIEARQRSLRRRTSSGKQSSRSQREDAMIKTLAIFAAVFALSAGPAFAAPAAGPYKLDAKGKCHAANGQFVTTSLCKAPAPAPPKHCKDPKTHKFTKCIGAAGLSWPDHPAADPNRCRPQRCAWATREALDEVASHFVERNSRRRGDVSGQLTPHRP